MIRCELPLLVIIGLLLAAGLTLADPTIRFDHDLHGEDAGIGCEVCHPDPENPGMPPAKVCRACHVNTQLVSDCRLCHFGQEVVRPDFHLPGWDRAHAVHLRSESGSACAHCHQETDCVNCHAGVGLSAAELDPHPYFASYQTAISPHIGLTVARVHGLNHRHEHATDALSKGARCTICHDMTRDCKRCHAERARAGIAGRRPPWHDEPDWGAIPAGVGSGGGTHAELARRDIEHCAFCHDINGADPACLQCHIDYDGLRGTDPCTHGPRFADEIGQGSFHDDDGATCYSCHRREPEGRGFCGCCH